MVLPQMLELCQRRDRCQGVVVHPRDIRAQSADDVGICSVVRVRVGRPVHDRYGNAHAASTPERHTPKKKGAPGAGAAGAASGGPCPAGGRARSVGDRQRVYRLSLWRVHDRTPESCLCDCTLGQEPYAWQSHSVLGFLCFCHQLASLSSHLLVRTHEGTGPSNSSSKASIL
jgi:hypothetical protein